MERGENNEEGGINERERKEQWRENVEETDVEIEREENNKEIERESEREEEEEQCGHAYGRNDGLE